MHRQVQLIAIMKMIASYCSEIWLAHLSCSVLKMVLRSCFTAWRRASAPSAESASEYAAPFLLAAFCLIKPATPSFCALAAGRLIDGRSSACFSAAALVLAKPAWDTEACDRPHFQTIAKHGKIYCSRCKQRLDLRGQSPGRMAQE